MDRKEQTLVSGSALEPANYASTVAISSQEMYEQTVRDAKTRDASTVKEACLILGSSEDEVDINDKDSIGTRRDDEGRGNKFPGKITTYKRIIM